MIRRNTGRAGKVLLAKLLTVTTILSGCTVSRVAAPESDGELRELRLKVGDEIHVVTIQRHRYTLKITEIEASELAGVTLAPREYEHAPEGQRIIVSYQDLALLEVRRFSPAHTAGALAGGVLVVGLIGLMVVGVPMGMPPPTPPGGDAG